MDKKTGSLVCVGLGITLGAHLTPISRSHIENADIVFTLGNTGLMQAWLTELNPNIHDLQNFYQHGKSRSTTYQQMTALILEHVRKGKKVVAAFYGHPGVFVTPAHNAISQAKAEGYYTKVEAGISAEDCLIADCGFDPGSLGCASFEANQFLRFQRPIDSSAYLILWQIAVVGDTTLTQFQTSAEHRQLLVEVLQQYYPDNHQVILYQAPEIANEATRIDKIALIDFPSANVNQTTTMLIPPATKLIPNKAMLKKLENIEKERLKPSLRSI